MLEMENSEISEIHLLLQILTVVATEDLKTKKNELKQKFSEE